MHLKKKYLIFIILLRLTKLNNTGFTWTSSLNLFIVPEKTNKPLIQEQDPGLIKP